MEVSQIFKRLALNEETDLPTLKTYLLHCDLISQEEHEFDGYNLEALDLSEAKIELLESFKDNIISNDNEETQMLEQFKMLRNVNLDASIQNVIEMVLSAGKEKETSPDSSSKNDLKKKRRTIIQISRDFTVSLSEIDSYLSDLGLEIQNNYSHEQAKNMSDYIVKKRTKTPNQTAETTETAQPKAELNLDELQPLVDEGASQLKKDILACILQENQAVTHSVISAYRHGILASLSDPNFVAQVREAASRESLRLNATRPYVAVLNGAGGTPGSNDIEADVKDVTPGSDDLEADTEEIEPENEEFKI